MAMLAKQLWRLIKFPDTLVSQLMKARYYPHSNPLEAQLGHHPSYVWRSLLEAQWVIRKGCRWLVRSGANIRFWKDQWTLKLPTFRIWSPRNGNEDKTVAAWLLDDG
ncbi:hypothetical protein RND81_10G130100 [Saponaria officinalis]|uniref:Uncharacterized protein n=1 Tax=Saponaria officinalis TaxID=3572 RepID=A0AAW1I2E9_SAPOF